MVELCQACSQLNLQRSDFTSPPFEPEGRYNAEVLTGTFGELRSKRSTCGLCDLIWLALLKSNEVELAEAKDVEIWSLRWAQNTNDFQPDRVTEGVEDIYGSALYPCFGEQSNRGDYGIQLVDGIDTEAFLRGRLITPEINIETVKAWRTRCQDLHGEDCGRTYLETISLSASSLTSLTVIDVVNLHLCDLPADAEYCALSYVWGDFNQPTTLVSNEKDFSKDGGLDLRLSQTVQDAIDVTRCLDIRYLWVDSLCITQDDTTKKKPLIDNMDSIYSNAAITLVAATGTGAECGLSGWSNKEGRNQHCIEMDQNFRLGILPYYQRELLECYHARRAWTYQETCLSPRCLVFMNGFIYFNCNAAVYAEYINAEVDGIEPEMSANILGKTDAASSVLQRYSQHVLSYTSRKLTYPSDGLNAFSGIAKALSRSMEVGEMIYGMPPSCFDWALIWRGRGSMTRREGFPSWSWVGWIGEVQALSVAYPDYDQVWLLKGTWVDWYVVGKDRECQPIWNTETANHIAFPNANITTQGPLKQENISREDTTREEASSMGKGERQKPSDEIREKDDAAADNEDEDEDEDEDEEEDEDDEEPCPTYGHTTTGSLFGRLTAWEAIKLIHPSSNDIVCPRSIICTSHEPANLLYFSAPTIILTAGSMEDLNQARHSDPARPLFDVKGRRCGFLFITNSDSQPDESEKPLKLALLSVTAFSDLVSHHAQGRTSRIYEAYGVQDTLEEYGESLPRDLNNFDFVNVLFLKETGGKAEIVTDHSLQSVAVYERAGVGCIYRAALEETDVQWCNFVMA